MRQLTERRCKTQIEHFDEELKLHCTFTVSANVVPFVPASMYGGSDRIGWLAEGGFCEDYEVVVLEAYSDTGSLRLDMAVKAADNFAKAIYRSKAIRDRIDEELLKAASEASDWRDVPDDD